MQTVSNQSRKRIEVVDFDTGNIASVQRMLARIGLESAMVRSPAELTGEHPVLRAWTPTARTSSVGPRRTAAADHPQART